MMGILIWLIVGGVIGWLASLIMKTDAQQGIFLNIIVGIVGAFLGGWLGGLLGIGGGDINERQLQPQRPADVADRRDRVAGDRQSVPARPRALTTTPSQQEKRPGQAGPVFVIGSRASSVQLHPGRRVVAGPVPGAWLAIDTRGRAVRAQRLRHQRQVDAQPQVAPERALPVIPPAEIARLRVERAVHVVQAQVV